jgi:outer membrane protein
MRCLSNLLLVSFVCLLPPSLQCQIAMHLSLADAQHLTIQNNPQFAAARLNAAAAYQVPQQYRAAYTPIVYGAVTGVGADAGSRLAAGALNNPSVYNRAASGLVASQLITDFGRTSNLIGMAKLQAQAQDQATETTRANLLLATSQAYFAVLRAQAIVSVADQTVAARQLVVGQVSALAASSMKSTLDVTFARVNLSDAKLLQVQAYNDLKSTAAQLATLMGQPNETVFTLDEAPMPDGMLDPVTSTIRQAIQNRPELKELRLQQNADERFTRAEHALNYPNIGLLGTAGLAPVGDPQITSRYGGVGLNVNIPILNGGLYKARTAEAQLKAQAAGQNVTDQSNQIIRDVRVAYLNASAAFDKLSLTKELLDQAQQSLTLAKTRYDNGLGSIVELSQAQLNLTSAQIADAAAKYDYQSQRVNLDYQAGVLH